MTRPIFCVHQVGKVGSTSLVRILEQVLPGETIYQTHVLNEASVLAMMQAWLDHPLAPTAKLHDHIVSSIELRRHFSRFAPPVSWHLLSVVREPIARDISAFFQNLQWQWMHLLPAETRASCERIFAAKRPDDEALPVDERRALIRDLSALFKARYRGEKYRAWFDREMRDVFGIDVFAGPFPAEAGYRIFQSGRARLGVFRLEDLRAALPRALGEWLRGSGRTPPPGDSALFERERANDGSSKAYSALYRAFLEEFSLEPAELDSVYDAPGVRHFYTAAEIAGFREKWSRPVPASLDEREAISIR